MYPVALGCTRRPSGRPSAAGRIGTRDVHRPGTELTGPIFLRHCALFGPPTTGGNQQRLKCRRIPLNMGAEGLDTGGGPPGHYTAAVQQDAP